MNRTLQKAFAGFVAGVLFGLGLAISRMADPEVVLAFLDLTGDWNPSLLLTMAGAVIVTLIGFRIVRRGKPLFEDEFHLPSVTQIDRRLILGSVLFGLGWGLAGYCPGPAITGLASGSAEPLIFLIAMVVGSRLEMLWQNRHPLEDHETLP